MKNPHQLELGSWQFSNFVQKFPTTTGFSVNFSIGHSKFSTFQFCYQSSCKSWIGEMYEKISNRDSPSPWIFLQISNMSISGRKSLKIIVILTKSSLTSYFKPKIISKTWKKLILIDSEYSKKAVLTMIGDISVDQACSVECALATII